ncbi:MAG: hypothetical protein ACI8Z1_003272 [Candidatus Azotimanducaceae bacterium]|jgi:hypothetical protein
MFVAAELDRPGAGIMYETQLDQAATFVPTDIIERIHQRDLQGPTLE